MKQTQTPMGRMFKVTITETRRRVITVYESELKEASISEAEQTVSDWWYNGQIILGDDDFSEVSFSAEEGGETDGSMD